MTKLWCLFALLFSMTLAGCTTIGPVRSCDEIALSALQPLMHEAMPAERVVEQIRKIYQLPPESVTVHRVEALSTAAPWLNEKYQVGDTIVSWGKDEARYVLTIGNERITGIGVMYDQHAPSTDQVIRCLGTPEKYWAFYSPGPLPTKRLAQLHMFFPASGVIASAVRFGDGERPPRFDGNARVPDFLFVPPGSGEEAIARFLSDRPDDMRQQIAQQLKPWPGNWEDIVIEIDPSLRQ